LLIVTQLVTQGPGSPSARLAPATDGVLPTQVAEWAGRSLDVLLRIYAKCLVGQDELAKRRIAEALRNGDDTPDGRRGQEIGCPD
jgi:hypothetical protein